LLRHGTPVPIHGGEGNLFTVNIAAGSRIAGRSVAEVFEQFPEILAVAIIRDQRVHLPRGSTKLVAGDQVLAATNESRSAEGFKQAAAGAEATGETR
jgi:Trk K+ transport system NAD-binding subunit